MNSTLNPTAVVFLDNSKVDSLVLGDKQLKKGKFETVEKATPLYFPEMHSNLHIINKRTLCRAMMTYFLKRYGILK